MMTSSRFGFRATLVHRLLLGFALAVLAGPVHAQTTGSCTLGTAQAELDVNNVRARLYNKGNLFYDGGDPQYEVPRGSGITPIFAAAVWVGGMVEDELRMAAATYAQFGQDYEFFPGPLDEAGNPPEDCAPFDRMYRVSVADIDAYLAGGAAAPDLAEWPVGLGAPTCVDTNASGRCDDEDEPVEPTSRDQVIDLDAGQLPAIVGDQGIWWVMNDAGGPHQTTNSAPLGMEARVLAFAFDRPDALGEATFYRYTFVYRGQSPLEDAFFTMFTDPDLGNYNDDYIGSDPARGLGFVYNAHNDDSGPGGYGAAPPALGLVLLRGPVVDGDALGMTRFGYFNSHNNALGNPNGIEEYYRYMTGFWRDGTPWTEGGNGYGGTTPVHFVYPNSGTESTPRPGYWSEVCPQPGCATSIPPSDRRFLVSTGPFRMEAGDEQEITFAYVWARSTDNFASIQAMKAAADLVRTLDDDWAVSAEDAPVGELDAPALLGAAYPNPSRGAAVVPLALRQAADVRVAVYDVLGREVAVLHEGPLAAGTHPLLLEALGLPAGVYVIRLDGAGTAVTQRVTLLR